MKGKEKVFAYGMLLILAFLFACHSVKGQKVQRSEYYAVLPFWESPYLPFKGACPITKEKALKRIHLQLDYDTENRVVFSHVKMGEHYKDFEGFFGHLYINAPLTKVSYDAKKEVHSFFDRFGNQISVMGNVYRKIYQKDDYGRNTRLTFEDKNGDPAEDLFGNRVYDWQHEKDGSIIETRKNRTGALTALRGDFQLMRTRMMFGQGGYFSLLQNIDDNGNIIPTESGATTLNYYYDTLGRFSRWEVYDASGKATSGPSHTAGEQNTFYDYDLKDIIFFDDQGLPAVHWSGAERWHFETDTFGNRTSLTYQNNAQKPMHANNGFAQIRFHWSKDGRFLLAQEYYDEEGNKTRHKALGIHSIVYFRDERGLITAIKYEDEKGNPQSRADNGVFSVEYEYDVKGALVSRKRFDKNGSVIKG